MNPYILWAIIASVILCTLSAALVLILIIVRPKPPYCPHCGGRLIIIDHDIIACEKCHQEYLDV